VTEVTRERPWRTAVAALAGLLVAVAIVGVAGILINRNIHQTVERAIAFDVELEDRGDDLRVAILDVRHYHRDLLLNNPSVPRIEAWQGRYAIMLEEIDALDELLERSPPDAELPEVGELRALAERYYDDFAAVVQAENDAQFVAVAEDLLPRIDAMEEIAEAVDTEGEQRAAAAFTEIDDASATGTIILVAVMIGLGGVGGVLAYAVLRLVQDQRRLVVIEQAAAAQMAEASRAKTDFIADASHELRTPLTVLRGNAEIGLAMEDECAHREILAEIVAEASRMSRLVDDLLFLARSDAASVPLEIQRVGAEPLIDRVIARAEILARERGASMMATVAGAGGLDADPERIEQAVLILVDNAAKYGPPAGTVEIAARTSEEHLVVEVRDRGPGIPADQLSHVFERFYRLGAGGRDRRTGGAGLGLAIAAAIVDGHGGRISATRRDGGGTTVTIELPLAGSMTRSRTEAR
jgi:two-component system, OmpR family, sensor histidine kinase VicK